MLIGILGGGLSGISQQYFLRHNCEVLEKENEIGGLCRTFEKEGFYYDIGGHILFSKDKKINNFIENVLSPNINRCRRNNKVFFKDKYVKYPFENGLGALNKQDIYECLIGYLKNRYPKPTNFRDWLYYSFGKGICEKYLVPYNRKIWKTPLENIGLDWINRLPKPPLEDIVKSSLGIETEGYQHQLNFIYPKFGGIQSLIKSLIKDGARIKTNFTVRKIQRKKQAWLVSDGKDKRTYDKLVITMPLKEALKCIEECPKNVVRAVDALRYNSVRIILVAINNTSLFDKSAVYLPDAGIIPHRICFMGYFSKNMVPRGHSSLIAEVTTHKGQPLYNVSNSELIQRVIGDLCKIGIISKPDIVTTDIRNIEYAYVIHDLSHKKNTEIVKKFFSSIGIELLGRFGEFEYINMDEVIKRSRNLSARLNKG